MLVKLDHFPRDRGENKKYLKPPPTVFWCFLLHLFTWHPQVNKVTPMLTHQFSVINTYISYFHKWVFTGFTTTGNKNLESWRQFPTPLVDGICGWVTGCVREIPLGNPTRFFETKIWESYFLEGEYGISRVCFSIFSSHRLNFWWMIMWRRQHEKSSTTLPDIDSKRPYPKRNFHLPILIFQGRTVSFADFYHFEAPHCYWNCWNSKKNWCPKCLKICQVNS